MSREPSDERTSDDPVGGPTRADGGEAETLATGEATPRFGSGLDLSTPGRVLFVRDEDGDERLAKRLEAALDGFTVTPASGRESALRELSEVECVVSGRFERGDTIGFVEAVREREADLPFVLVPEEGSETFAAEAVAAGVTEYVHRDGEVPIERVAERIESAIEAYRERRASAREGWVLEQIQETDPASTILVDEEGRCVWANDRARERLDLDERDDPYVVGDTDVYDADGELIPPEERPYYRVFETGQPVRDFECRIDLDGDERWISINAEPIEGPEGNEYAVISSADVTDRKRYERELEREREELEAELSEVFERVSDAFYAVDEEFRFTYVNEGAEELLQASEEELLGTSVWEAYPEATDTDAYRAFHEALETQEPAEYELYFEPLDFWVNARVYPSETGLSVYFRDVTERKEREREIEEQARQQEAVADLGERALGDPDLDSLLSGAAALLVDTLGADVCEVLERRPDAGDLIARARAERGDDGEAPTPEDGDHDRGDGDRQRIVDLESGRPASRALSGAVRIEDDPGGRLAERDVESGIAVPVGSTDDPWGVLGVYATASRTYAEHDVQFVQGVAAILAAAIERREYERELEEYRTLAETVQDGMYVVDDEGRFAMVNGALADLAGYDREELLGAHVGEIVPEDALRRAGNQESLLRAGEREAARFEFDLESRDGESVPVEAAFTLLEREDGARIERAGVIRDVTERKRFEERLEALNRMSDALFVAESDRGVGEAVVDVVIEAIGLSEVVLYRYDEDHDELYPDVASEEPAFVRAPIPRDADDAVARAFEAGESERTDDLDGLAWAEDASTRDLQSVLLVPIEEYGILAVGSSDPGRVDPTTERLVEIVAANAATAFERVEHARERRRQREHLQVLSDIDSLVQRIAGAVVRQSSRAEIERLVCDRLAASGSYEFAWIASAADGELDVEYEAGVEGYLDGVDLRLREDEREPAVQAIRTGDVQTVESTGSAPASERWRERATHHGFQSSAAIPIVYEDERYGVLGVHVDRDRAFGPEECEALSRLGTIVAHAIRSVDRERKLRESERRYRTVIDRIPNGSVALIDEDLRYLTVGGENLDRYDLDPEDLEGTKLPETEILSPDLRERLEAACRAALDGEEVSLEFDFRGRTLSARVVPVREDGEVHSAMIFSQDVTERRRQREQIEHERERLEFMNRLIRHNLLNSLNVVDARLDLLEGRVDYEVASHLETAHERTEEMIDLVEAVRSLMRVIVEEEDHELEPVDLESRLHDQVDAARGMFPDATFDLEVEPVEVMADPLLEEAIENLLVNAVQHNDADEPRVEVCAEADDGSVRIAVADNGPGVPESLKSRVFEKGEQGFESPGSGFGLHLVREIVEAYGGEIDIQDNDPRGAVFEITLPRA